MGKIYLVRHGQSADNAARILGGRRDSVLTELGIKQAQDIAERLLREDIDLIYSSPLKRALGTASIIAEKLKIKNIEVDARLMERDFGVLSGRPYVDIKTMADEIVDVEGMEYFLNAENAEDFPTLLLRGKEVIDEIRSKHANNNVLIATHGDIGKMIRAAYNGWTWEEGLQTHNFNNTDVFELTQSELLNKIS